VILEIKSAQKFKDELKLWVLFKLRSVSLTGNSHFHFHKVRFVQNQKTKISRELVLLRFLALRNFSETAQIQNHFVFWGRKNINNVRHPHNDLKDADSFEQNPQAVSPPASILLRSRYLLGTIGRCAISRTRQRGGGKFYARWIRGQLLTRWHCSRGHVSAGHGRVGKHRKHPGGRGLAGGQHHHRTNMDKYHPGYFGKVGMRYFHKQGNHFWKPVINLDKVCAVFAFVTCGWAGDGNRRLETQWRYEMGKEGDLWDWGTSTMLLFWRMSSSCANAIWSTGFFGRVLI